MDRGTWQVTVHEVAKSGTRLSNFTFSFFLFFCKKGLMTKHKMELPIRVSLYFTFGFCLSRYAWTYWVHCLLEMHTVETWQQSLALESPQRWQLESRWEISRFQGEGNFSIGLDEAKIFLRTVKFRISTSLSQSSLIHIMLQNLPTFLFSSSLKSQKQTKISENGTLDDRILKIIQAILLSQV